MRLTTEQGSNNWVVDGTMTATGKPMLANDPHRPVQLPSLRKTVHLVGPGWNAIGAGEPALPGIALGHNENVAFGFTIVGIDQQDSTWRSVNPANPAEYRYRGAWKTVRDRAAEACGQRARADETDHAALHRARSRHLRGSRRGIAPTRCAGSAASRARRGTWPALRWRGPTNWKEFRAAMERYKVPSENLVYADTEGNIGWQVGGLDADPRGLARAAAGPGRRGPNTNGRASASPTSCRSSSTRRATSSPPPTTTSCRRATRIPLGLRRWALPFRIEAHPRDAGRRPQVRRRGFRAHAAGRGFAARPAVSGDR